MWRRWFIAAALLAQAPAVVAYGATSAGLAATATPTAAPPASATPTESGWSVQGEVTGRALVANDVGVDDQGTPAGQNLWLNAPHRRRQLHR